MKIQTSILYNNGFERRCLFSELNSWSRLDLIEWLSWNDSNGVYKDEDSLREFDQIISREEALEIMVRQITEA
jgi:hypothetical protein